MTLVQPYRKSEMTVMGDHEQLHTIRDFVENFVQQCSVPEETVNLIVVAVDEACSNIVRHGGEAQPHKTITIGLHFENSLLTITVHDNALSFNPANVPTPNMSEYFQEFRKGGLGLHIIRMVMDEIEYLPAKSAMTQNMLTMRKKII